MKIYSEIATVVSNTEIAGVVKSAGFIIKGTDPISTNKFVKKPGDVVFIPRNTPHAAESVGEENMVIYWMLGGVGSFEAAGYKKEK